MKNKPKLVVIDTCVYVDALYSGSSRAKETDDDRANRSASLLSKVDKGEYLAGLLPIVLAEINSTRQLGGDVPPQARYERKKAIDAYFNGYGHITLEHDERVGQLAAKLAREGQMKGPDALVVASAVVHEALVLYSWDKKILRLDGNVLVRKLRICEPPMKAVPDQISLLDLLEDSSS